MGKYYFDNEGSVFSIEEEPEFFRLRVWRSEIRDEHVEDFLDTTVEWLSSNPDKGILIDFSGVRAVCSAFTVELCRNYEDIKRRGLYVRFVNVDPSIQPYIDVQNITVVMTVMPRKPVLSAKAVLDDLSKNVPDQDLMRKYGLSERGLSSMFKKLMRKGLITEHLLSRRRGLGAASEAVVRSDGKDREKTTLNATDVLRDLNSNVSDSGIMAKFKLSRRGLESVLDKLQGKGLITKEQVAKRKKRTSS